MSSSSDTIAVPQHSACRQTLRRHWSHGTREIRCLNRVLLQKHPAKIRTFAGLFCHRALFCRLCRHTLQGHGTCRSSLNMNEMKTGLVWCVQDNEFSSHCTAQHFVWLIHICAMTHSHVCRDLCELQVLCCGLRWTFTCAALARMTHSHVRIKSAVE